jgi:hypothetical protein
MDYHSMNQPTDQPTEQTEQAVTQDSSSTAWYVVGGVAVAVIALALWYFYYMPISSADTQSTAVEQTQILPTTADIANELNQIPDNSAALSGDADASVRDVQGF